MEMRGRLMHGSFVRFMMVVDQFFLVLRFFLRLSVQRQGCKHCNDKCSILFLPIAFEILVRPGPKCEISICRA